MQDILMEIFNQIVILVGHIAWPASVLILVFAIRNEIRSIVAAISRRISDSSSDISIGMEGVSIKNRIEAAQAKLESLTIDQEQLKAFILQTVQTTKSDHTGVDQKSVHEDKINQQLLEMGQQYMKISAPDVNERKRLKTEAAKQMTNFVITNNIPKDFLASLRQESIALALASTIHTFPEKGDVKRLLNVANAVTQNYIKYWFALALSQLFSRHLVTKEDVEPVRKLLENFSKGADPPLLDRITHTESVIKMFVYEASILS